MNKKTVNFCLSRNIFFGIVTLFTTITFMMQVSNALDTIRVGGVLDNVKYNVFVLSISTNTDTYNHVYHIVNYPLIPILIGVIFNIYFIVKNHKRNEKFDS